MEASSGLETALASWIVSDRRKNASSLHAIIERKNPQARFEFEYSLDDKRATVVTPTGRRLVLELAESPETDARSWRCDCPVRDRVCLHTALAARGLTDPISEGAPAEELGADPRFAVELELSPGLAAAAQRSSLRAAKIDDDSLRVGAARVRRVQTKLECDCPMGSASACVHRAVAVRWARGEQGSVRTEATRTKSASLTPPEAVATPRSGEKLPDQDLTRFQPILDRVDRLVAELVSFGLSRTSPATLERVDGLIISAQTIGVRDGAPRNAGLGRLRRRLESLREVLAQFQQRVVTTSELRVLRELAIVRNLARALRANTGHLPLFDFAGATQQEYEPIAVLDVQGLGFEAWTSDAGFVGVTAYVTDLRTGRILTRGNARPVEQVSTPDVLAAEPAFGGAAVGYAELARGRFLVSGAELAPDSGRLSGSKKTQLAKRSALALDDPKLRNASFAGIADAVRIARRLGFDALGRPPASPPVALIPMSACTPPEFDRATQRLRFFIATTAGPFLPIVTHYRDDRSLWIDNLEKMARARAQPKVLFARFSLDSSDLWIEPITAYYDKGAPQHLTYKSLEIPS